MFMRFRGGGIGHIYMRQVEPWLDATGWGTTQPSLGGRYPEPGREPPPHSGGRAAGPTTSTQGHHRGSEDRDEDEDSEEDADAGELEDGDGEDPELLEEDDSNGSDEDEGVNGGGRSNRHTGSRDSEDEAGESETEEGEEGDNL
jgi:hypothetical protein